jgi:hypothetical protein
MPLSISLFPDLDGLEDLIGDSETGLQVYLASLAIVLALLIAHAVVDRLRQRSPVEKLIKGRGR